MIYGLISIIVPVFNCEKYIEMCINSILCQTYKNIEIIIIDDGSTDNSSLICNRMSKMDNRITVIHSVNRGSVRARKIGLSHAKGEYIAFVDADDYIEPQMYEILIEIIRSKNVDIVHTGFYREHSSGNRGISCSFSEQLCEVKKDRISYLNNHFFGEKSEFVSPSMWSKLYRRDVVVNNFSKLNDDVQYGEDMVFFIRCCFEVTRIYHLNQAFYHYRIYNDSMTNKKSHMIRREISLLSEIEDVFQEYAVKSVFQDRLDLFVTKHLLCAFKDLNLPGVQIRQYEYEDIHFFSNKRIIIYGAAEVGIDYYWQIKNSSYCDSLVAIVDSKADEYDYIGVDVQGVNTIFEEEYDYIVIAVLHERTKEIIEENLLKHGVKQEKIVWKKPKELL